MPDTILACRVLPQYFDDESTAFLGNNRQAAGRFYSNPQIEYPSIGIRVARPAKPSEE